jgi:hypothetical protein
VVGGVDGAGVETLGLAVDGVLFAGLGVEADWSTNATRWPRTLPGKLSGLGKSPPEKCGSRVACDMNFWKIVAGSEPPLTFIPCTLVIFRDCPSG